jgi:hypothetical protein
MSSLDDWERFQLKKLERLRKSKFSFADYAAPTAEWDHDHCEGCSAKFALIQEAGVLRRGYFTIYPIRSERSPEPEIIRQARESGQEVLKKPDDKLWVCPECFEAFQVRLDWKLVPSRKA